MFPTILEKLTRNPQLRKCGRGVLRTFGVRYISKDKKRLLSLAESTIQEKIPLDVSCRSGFHVFHNPGNSLISRSENFEPEVQAAIQALLFLDRQRGNTPRFADIGVNIGLHSLAVKQKFPEMDIVAFDPSPFSWKYFEITLRQNRIERIQLLPFALGNADGVTDLYTWGESSAGDSVRNTGRQPNLPFSIIQVPIKRLDDLSEVGDITVIKMDCEGAEISILQGMPRTISKNRPLIVTEFYAENQHAFGISGDEVFDTVSELEYSMFTLWFKRLNRKSFLDLHQNGEENFILLPNEILGPEANHPS